MYIYNIGWEDPLIDMIYFGMKKNSRILTITTGGDNALTYLLKNPKSIDCCDINKHQNYLLEIKISCIKSLNQAECFELFGILFF